MSAPSDSRQRIKDPDRVVTGRIGAYKLHGLYAGKELTAAAHAGFLEKFRKEALAAAEARGEELKSEELHRRAVSLRKSYMLTLAREREKRRVARKAKSSTNPARPVELQEGDGDPRTDAPAAE